MWRKDIQKIIYWVTILQDAIYYKQVVVYFSLIFFS